MEVPLTDVVTQHRDDKTLVPAIEVPQIDLTEEDDFPEGGLRAWLVVLGAYMILLPSFGFMVSIGTLQEYWTRNQLSVYTTRDIGWIPSVFVYLALGLGVLVGPIFDRYGHKMLLRVGGSLYVGMVFALAQCQQYWQFLLVLGFWGGICGACLTTTSLAVVGHWFKRRRGLAGGLAMAGSSTGGLVLPLILRVTLPKYGYAWAIRFLGFMFIGCMIIGNLLVKARLEPGVKRGVGAQSWKRTLSLDLFGDWRFTLLTISLFGFELVLFGALGLLPTYARSNPDYPEDVSFYVISVMNGISTLGRFFPGLVSDIYGRFNVMAGMTALTLIFMLALWLPLGTSSLVGFYIFVGLFGFGTGTWMGLLPACIGQICPIEEFGRYYGTLYLVASLATLVCIPIGGEMLEAVGPQTMVIFFCAVTAVSLVTFLASRWACLDWKWKWRVKV